MIDLPGITLRSAQDGDLPQVVNLDRLAFAPLSSNEAVEREWYGNTLDLPGRKLFLSVDDRTALAVGCYGQVDLGLYLEGELFPAMGIAGVAVAPHYRGRKIAQLMMEHALEEARSQQLPLVMLYPFQHGFYRRLGWAWVGRSYQYRVAAQHLPLYAERTGVIPYNPSQDRQSLESVYQDAAVQHNGWLHRRDWQWHYRLKPTNGREIYGYAEAGVWLGYVVLQFTQLDPSSKLLAAVVQEWVALQPSAYRGLLGFLASLRSQVSTIVWNTDQADPFPHLLKEQRCDPALPAAPFEFGFTHHLGAIGGGFMWRLVDLAAAFHTRPIQLQPPFVLTLQVTDPVFETRSLTVTFADGQMHLTPQPTSTVVRISIEHLTELFCGFRRSRDLLWTGEIALEGNQTLLANLDAAWQTPPPFCWDFF